MDLLTLLFGATKEIGIVQVLLLLSILCLGYMVIKFNREQSRQIESHGRRIEILKKDVDACHKEKRLLMNQYRDIRNRCEQYNHRLGESLAREKVLSDLLSRMGILGDKNITG